jgi:bacillithiol system protein YtxJ
MCNFQVFETSNGSAPRTKDTADQLMEEITTLERITSLIDAKTPAILFKYSPTCGISQVAQEAWDEFAKRADDVHLAQCDVIGARPAARGMVDLVRVAHQSPQVLVLKNGVCLAHTSHYSITPDWLDRARELLLRTP